MADKRNKFVVPSLSQLDSEQKDNQVGAVGSLFKAFKNTVDKPRNESISSTDHGKQPHKSTTNQSSNTRDCVQTNGTNIQDNNLTTVTNKKHTVKSSSTSTESGTKSITKAIIVPVKKDQVKDVSVAKTVDKHNLIVSNRQKGNPILKFVRNVPWEYDDIVPDYEMNSRSCALYLSLRYHILHPDYIHDRLKVLGKRYLLRVLLVEVDIKDPHHALKELSKMCILAECTLVLAFSSEEAGRYLETYKAYENKPPEAIMERLEANPKTRFIESLTTVKSVNKTDAGTLLSTFNTFEKIVNTSEEDLSLLPGFGPQKAKRLHSVFHEPFLKSRKKIGMESTTLSKQSPTKTISNTDSQDSK